VSGRDRSRALDTTGPRFTYIGRNGPATRMPQILVARPVIVSLLFCGAIWAGPTLAAAQAPVEVAGGQLAMLQPLAPPSPAPPLDPAAVGPAAMNAVAPTVALVAGIAAPPQSPPDPQEAASLAQSAVQDVKRHVKTPLDGPSVILMQTGGAAPPPTSGVAGAPATPQAAASSASGPRPSGPASAQPGRTLFWHVTVTDLIHPPPTGASGVRTPVPASAIQTEAIAAPPSPGIPKPSGMPSPGAQSSVPQPTPSSGATPTAAGIAPSVQWMALATGLGFLLRALFGLPLIHRIRGAQLLHNPTRRRVLDVIASNPGIHFNELMRRLGIARGQTAHHVHALKRGGFVKSATSRGYTCFFLAGEDPRMALANRALTSAKARVLLGRVQADPGAALGDLCDAGLMSRRMAHYHARHLANAGLVTLDGDRAQIRLTPTNLADRLARSSPLLPGSPLGQAAREASASAGTQNPA
jgi:predicted transcriptional regulator